MLKNDSAGMPALYFIDDRYSSICGVEGNQLAEKDPAQPEQQYGQDLARKSKLKPLEKPPSRLAVTAKRNRTVGTACNSANTKLLVYFLQSECQNLGTNIS